MENEIQKENRLLLVQLLVLSLIFIVTLFFILFHSFHQKYIVHFYSNGGNQIASQMVSKDKKVSIPRNPKREGYLFLGWYEDNTLFDFETKVNSDIQLKAKWRKM